METGPQWLWEHVRQHALVRHAKRIVRSISGKPVPSLMSDADRVAMTLSCRDSDTIPKVAGAGDVRREGDHDVQVMHNGVRVLAGGHHGDWMEEIIRGLKGHHEPQEELAFHHLLSHVKPGGTMIELGAFWAYYSLWFLHAIEGGRVVAIEPDPANLEVGRTNARLNGKEPRISFHQGWVGAEGVAAQTIRCESTGKRLTLPSYDMDRVLKLVDGGPIELLHIDAQGVELAFTRSMARAVEQALVRFLVVSTHHSSMSGSPTTHQDCIATIRELGGHILLEHDVQSSFSGDGLIVASFRAEDYAIKLPPISRNKAEHSLFPMP